MTRQFSISLIAASLLAVSIAAQDPQSTFRSTSDTVPVYVTVTDKSNRLITNLTREDFSAFDNGKLQPLTVFDNTPQPIRLIVMLDVSGSMYGNLPLLRAACEELFTRLRPDDRARLGTFGNDIVISPTFTNDARELIGSLPSVIENAPTPLWRAMDKALDEFKGVEGRHVILVLSDGKDSMIGQFGQKFVGQLEIIERAQREEVMIYSVGLKSRNRPGGMAPIAGANLGAMMADDLPDPGLGSAALDTGGGYFEIGPRDDLNAAFTRVADELHSQYLLGFAPTSRDGKLHKLEVKVTTKDAKPRARKNYQAPKGSK